MWALAAVVSGFVVVVALLAGSLGWSNPPGWVSLLLVAALAVFLVSGAVAWVQARRERRRLRQLR